MPRAPLLLLLLLLSLLLLINQSSSSPPKRFVSLRLRAAWPSSSFAIEAAYAVAEFDAALFWSFVAGMSSNSATLFPDSDDPSPHLLYNASMSVASSLMSSSSLPLLAASLSLRRLNPRVTMLQVRCNPLLALYYLGAVVPVPARRTLHVRVSPDKTAVSLRAARCGVLLFCCIFRTIPASYLRFSTRLPPPSPSPSPSLTLTHPRHSAIHHQGPHPCPPTMPRKSSSTPPLKPRCSRSILC
jgi:hypothetical protein